MVVTHNVPARTNFLLVPGTSNEEQTSVRSDDADPNPNVLE